MADPTVESLQAEIAELRAHLERVNPAPARPKPESVDTYLKMAWTRMKPDAARAAGLFLAWCQQDSQVADSLQAIIQEAIESRIGELAETDPAPIA